jgi:hypothetical protein
LLALAAMLNNYFHDLATAVFAVSTISSYFLFKRLESKVIETVRPVINTLTRLAYGALIWIIVGGVFRALAYRRFEWMGAAGEGQIPVLIVKHVILVSFTGLGLYLLVSVRRKLKRLA